MAACSKNTWKILATTGRHYQNQPEVHIMDLPPMQSKGCACACVFPVVRSYEISSPSREERLVMRAQYALF